MDVVLQGQILPETEQLVSNMQDTGFIENIIISTWWDQDIPDWADDFNVGAIRSTYPDFKGIGNRNYQIKSSHVGLERVRSSYCAKFRTDQIFPSETLELMNEFYLEHSNNGTNHKIFTLGLYKNWPFHPRDHVFWGQTAFVNALFEIPYDDATDGNYGVSLRAEAWIGANYIAKYNHSVAFMLKNYDIYLVDGAPYVNEGLALDKEVMPDYFKSFPRLEYSWPKVGLESYYHEYTSTNFSEFWHEDINND